MICTNKFPCKVNGEQGVLKNDVGQVVLETAGEWRWTSVKKETFQ